VTVTPDLEERLAIALVAQRLRAGAEAALESPPEPLDDADADADACLTALVEQLALTRDPSLAWLIVTLLAGAYPTAQDLRHLLRVRDLEDVPDLTLAILDRARHVALVHGVQRPARVVTGVVVDVDMSARVDLHNGIQRVVREIVNVWWAGHDLTLAAWTSPAGSLRTLTSDEEDRAVRWGRTPRHPTYPDTAARADAITELLVPWHATVVLAEVPLSDRCPRLAGLAEMSGSEVVGIGYDAIPFVSADLRPFGEPNAFASYLTVVKYAKRIASISSSSQAEFGGYVDALAAQGLRGPDVSLVVQPATVPPAPDGYVRHEPERPLVVIVGRLEPHKNHTALLAATERLWREGLRFDLKIIGTHGWHTERVERQLEQLRELDASVEWMRGVGDDELWQLLRDASFTVFISLHEGFGLPVAESLACGTPVLTTNYGSQAEIAQGGGALTVDPRDDASVLAGLRAMLTDRFLVERLRAEAKEYPVQTWKQYADDVWSQLVPGRPR